MTERATSLLPSGARRRRAATSRRERWWGWPSPPAAEFARGLVNYDAGELRRLRGVKTREIEATLGYKGLDEVIHRDNLAILSGEERARHDDDGHRGDGGARARAAKEASRHLELATTRAKNDGLAQMARGLEEKAAAIIEANRADLERARAKGFTRAFVDRLTLTDDRIDAMAAGIRHVASLPDPVGETVETWRRPNGLEIARVRVPLGVVGFIYESRPNVTADAAALCLKAGNAVVLRGGQRGPRVEHDRSPTSSPRPSRRPGCPPTPCSTWTRRTGRP